jgi:hypothetical protein
MQAETALGEFLEELPTGNILHDNVDLCLRGHDLEFLYNIWRVVEAMDLSLDLGGLGRSMFKTSSLSMTLMATL